MGGPAERVRECSVRRCVRTTDARARQFCREEFTLFQPVPGVVGGSRRYKTHCPLDPPCSARGRRQVHESRPAQSMFELRITNLEREDRCAAPASAAERPPELILEWYRAARRRRPPRLVGRPGRAPEADHHRVVTAPRSNDHFPPCPYFGGDGQLYTASGVGRITDVTGTRRPYQRLPQRRAQRTRCIAPFRPNLGSCLRRRARWRTRRTGRVMGARRFVAMRRCWPHSS